MRSLTTPIVETATKVDVTNFSYDIGAGLVSIDYQLVKADDSLYLATALQLDITDSATFFSNVQTDVDSGTAMGLAMLNEMYDSVMTELGQ